MAHLVPATSDRKIAAAPVWRGVAFCRSAVELGARHRRPDVLDPRGPDHLHDAIDGCANGGSAPSGTIARHDAQPDCGRLHGFTGWDDLQWHFVILTLSRQAALAGQPWAPLLLSFRRPPGVYALDILAWDFFFPLSMLFAVPFFGGGPLTLYIHVLMTARGHRFRKCRDREHATAKRRHRGLRSGVSDLRSAKANLIIDSQEAEFRASSGISARLSSFDSSCRNDSAAILVSV